MSSYPSTIELTLSSIIMTLRYQQQPLQTQISERKDYTHHLKSKFNQNGKILLVTGYDYFLQKRDLGHLFHFYQEIILVPMSIDDDHFLSKRVMPLLVRYHDVHLVVNPFYDKKNHIIYEFFVKQSKSLKISTVYDFCERELKKIYISETMNDCILEESVFQNMTPTMRTLKRGLDWLVATGLGMLALPIWILSALKIKSESPEGLVFYLQKRVGFEGTEFDCVKFRSMRTDAEQHGPMFSKPNDKRTFRYGAFMRMTRIDELPQILNIFRGELSLIGPRPERKVFTDSFEEVIPYYDLRNRVKPGISGYAQIMYPYGAGNKDARHKLMYDLYYIKNWSVGLELYILIRTIFTVLSQKGQ